MCQCEIGHTTTTNASGSKSSKIVNICMLDM